MNYLRTFLLYAVIFSGSALPAQERSVPTENGNKTDTQIEQFDRLVKDTAKRRARLDELVTQLESNVFRVRQHASDELTELINSTGLEHYRDLASKVDSLSRDAKARIRKILKQQEFDGENYTLKDGEGEIIPNAICEFFLIPDDQHNFTLDGIEILGRTFSDHEGKIAAPIRSDRRTGIKVYAPEYGTAGAILASRQTDVFLPVIKQSSPSANRALVGVLQDEEGNPIASQPVSARHIRIQGVGSYATRGRQTAVITDRLGRFRLYTEPSKPGQVTPFGATFSLVIESNSIFPIQPLCKNNQENVITIPRGQHFHRFKFEGIESRKLIYAQIYYRGLDGKSNHTSLSRNYITSGGKLLAGHYEARVAKTNFKPVIVTEESPETIVFERTGNKTYAGKVVDGKTDEPMANAIVFAFDANVSGKSLADLNDQQWQRLSEAPVVEMESHPAYHALRKIKSVQAIGKTDDAGKFAITTKESQEAYGLIAVAPGMLPYEVRALPQQSKTNSSSKDSSSTEQPIGSNENRITVETMHLFPAARVRFQAVLPKGIEFQKDNLTLWPEWEIDSADQPEWFNKFRKAKEPRRGLPGFYPAFYHAKIGSINELLVPADVGLHVKLVSSTTARLAPHRIPNLIRLAPGKVKDLERIELASTFPVVVRVVGPDGKPLFGLPVRHSYKESSWRLATLTNAEGNATIHVAANLPGQFGVIGCKGLNGQRIQGDNLTVPVELDGPTQETYTIEFTKEQVSLLPNR